MTKQTSNVLKKTPSLVIWHLWEELNKKCSGEKSTETKLSNKQNETFSFHLVYLCHSPEQRNWQLFGNSKLLNAPENTVLGKQYSICRRQTKRSKSKNIYIFLF